VTGIGLVVHWDGAPVEDAAVAALARALEHRGRDGTSVVRDGHIALVCRHDWTTPEDIDGAQPVRDAAGGFDLVFEGRLDSRPDLLADLGDLGQSHGPVSDAAIVAAAWRRWGPDAFGRIVGPFAVALFDHHAQAVVLARDPMGSRSLFYHRTRGGLVVASEETAVTAYPGIDARIDESVLAQLYAVRVPEDGATLFAAVREVRPAHVVTVDAQRERHDCFWQPDPEPRLRYRDDREYAAQFADVLRQAVTCRLRAVGTPVSLLSGGLDSGSIVATACRDARGDAGDRALHALSWVFDEISDCDERPYIDALLQRTPCPAIRVVGDDAWPLSDAAAPTPSPNAPDTNPYRVLLQRAYRAARDAGARSLLTGAFGDSLYAGAEHAAADLLFEGRPGACAREIARAVRARGGTDPSARAQLRRCTARALGRRGSSPRPSGDAPPWLTDAAASRLPSWGDVPVSVASARRPGQHRLALGALTVRSWSAERASALRAGIDLRAPYRDRRLVEFMLDLPGHQLARVGSRKHVVRVAMRDLLPAATLDRQGSTSLAPLLWRGVFDRERDTVADLLEDPDAWWPRFVRRPWLDAVLTGGTGPTGDGPARAAFWICVAVERWRRDRFPGVSATVS
jgi:asparagine synthase (glutamine-hydrolysing)